MSNFDRKCIVGGCLGGGALFGGALFYTLFGDNIIVYFGVLIGAWVGCKLGRLA